MKSKPKGALTRAQTAHHEAGHAVAFAILRLSLAAATIKPGDRGGGHVEIKPKGRRLFKKVRGQDAFIKNNKPHIPTLRKQLVACAAGSYAQQWYCRKSGERCAGGDASDFAAATKIAEQIAAVANGRETVDWLIRWSEGEALRLVVHHWRAIEAVAAALLERETVGAREIHELVSEAKVTHRERRGR